MVSPTIDDVGYFAELISKIKVVQLENPFFKVQSPTTLKWSLGESKKIIINNVNYDGPFEGFNFVGTTAPNVPDITLSGNSNGLPVSLQFTNAQIGKLEISKIATKLSITDAKKKTLFYFENCKFDYVSILNCSNGTVCIRNVSSDQTFEIIEFKKLDCVIDGHISPKNVSVNSSSGSVELSNETSFRSFTINTDSTMDIVCKAKNIEELALMTGLRKIEIFKTKIGKLSIRSAQCTKISVLDAQIENCTVYDSSFKSELLFAGTSFQESPLFENSNFCVNSHFVDCDFRDFSSQAIPRYRHLKTVFASLGNDLDEGYFASLEMQARVEVTKFKDEPLTKIAGFFYNLFNSYGRSVSRPFGVYLALLFVFAILYESFFDVDVSFNGTTNVLSLQTYWGEWILAKDWKRSLLFSFFNSLGPFRYLLKLDFLYIQSFYGKVWVFFQGIISSVNLYLLIVGIKKRFKQV